MVFTSTSLKLKATARRVLPFRLRRVLGEWLRKNRNTGQNLPVSSNLEVIKEEVLPELLYGWQDRTVAERQHAAFAPLLRQMYEGNPREDFVAVATAIQMTASKNPLIIEVGCGSGWNFEVLTYLLKRPVRYIGLDYSFAMTGLGKRSYPEVQFVVGDATALPFQDEACDILLSGTVLMHVLGYPEAIRESRRVTRKWCIFHTVPVLQKRSTTLLRKSAYGQPVIEVIFNEEELLDLIEQNGLILRHVLSSLPYNLEEVLQEVSKTYTYICEVG
jgi:SAM-dependent methyltransferase